MQTIFHWRELLQLMQGREYFDEERARRDESWKKCYETRERKAHTEIVLSLHGDLLDRFKSDIETANPAQVWAALLPTYDGTQGTNAVYLKQDLYARRLHQGEQVTEYVGDLQQMRRELERMEITLAEGEMASIVLSNAVAVYPSIANDHTQRVSRLRGGYDKYQRVQDDVNLLLVAERTARDQLSRENRDADQGVQRQVNLVTRNSSSGREQQQQGGNKRRYNGGGGRGSGEKKRQDDEVARKRRDEIAEKKRNSECNACHQRGHWWKECPERKSTDPREICTMAGAVLRRVEKEQKDDRPADAQRDRQQDHPRVDFVGTHPVTLSFDRQRADVNSYSKIYTRHELAALVGRDVEERLGQARDTQRDEQSVEYSPTSPTDADADSLHGATGLLPTRRVLVARSGRPDMVPPNKMEWIFDSGAQVNVTGDLALLNNVKNLKQAELLEGATGGFERVELEGAVLMPVVNEHSGDTETRLLENVRYSPGSKVNLISQTYMQFKCGYKLIVSDDQLVKPTMKLTFVMRDGLYCMRVERRNKLVLSAQKPSADSNVMELLHNRLNHVAMDTIKEGG
ncbi:hypothetical protein PR001_g8166 [Phytophthora rubi]|uniref:Retrovirus-related Pol polyprotein from transposon TNT 1-94-like beta-barrel domain-containing protein n=1 Tax=Phytophthora rubi TaxID=129364 RepID=A0A6A3N9K4_9STRA|nr:hypothetical protein PR001_g8166 [Phytophthora rubi]